MPSLEEEYKKMVSKARSEIDRLVQAEKAQGLVANEWVMDGDPIEDIQKVVADQKVDLILMLAHQEGRLEHFLFGKTNDAIIRRLPATVMLVK